MAVLRDTVREGGFVKLREKDLTKMVEALAECFEHFEALSGCIDRLELNNARGHIAAGIKLTKNWRSE